MTLSSPEALGEVIESPLRASKELNKEERDHVRDLTRQITSEYLQEYSAEQSGEEWANFVTRLHEKSIHNEDVLNRNYSNNETPLLSALNKMLGDLPLRYIEPRRALLDYPNEYSREERHQFRLALAAWQGEAVAALNTLGNIKISSNGEQRLVDSFFNVAKVANRRIYENDSQRSDEEVGTLVSGVYGPVALTHLLHKQGYDVWLPTPETDVLCRVDLIFGRGNDGVIPEHLYMAQIKSKRSDQDGVQFSRNPGELSTEEQNGWEATNNYARKLTSSTTFYDKGVDFSPTWVKISHAGLRDADDWRSGIAYIEEQEVGQIETSEMNETNE